MFNDDDDDDVGCGGFGASSVFFSAEITLSRNELRPAAPDTGGVVFDFGLGLLGPTKLARGLILRMPPPPTLGSLGTGDFLSELLPSAAMASARKSCFER